MHDPLPAEETRAVPAERAASDFGVAARVFLFVFLGLVGAMVASAAGFADLGVLWSGGQVDRLARFNTFLALVAAYTAAATIVARRGAARDFRALRSTVETTPSEWNTWERRFTGRGGHWLPALCGVLVGVGIEQLGTLFGSAAAPAPWLGLRIWAPRIGPFSRRPESPVPAGIDGTGVIGRKMPPYSDYPQPALTTL